MTDKLQNLSIYARTSIEERVMMIAGGRELIAITVLPKILPIAYPTIKNRISAGTFPMEIIRFNKKNFVRTADVVSIITNQDQITRGIHKKVGRKSNQERQQNKL